MVTREMRCTGEANMAHLRHARPDSGLGFQAEHSQNLFSCSLFAREGEANMAHVRQGCEPPAARSLFDLHLPPALQHNLPRHIFQALDFFSGPQFLFRHFIFSGPGSFFRPLICTGARRNLKACGTHPGAPTRRFDPLMWPGGSYLSLLPSAGELHPSPSPLALQQHLALFQAGGGLVQGLGFRV